MTEMELLREIGMIREEYILEASPEAAGPSISERKKRRYRRQLGIAAAAAAALLVLTIHPALTRRRPAHVLVADLPYGVQHAPVESGRKPESFQSLLRRSLPLWHGCLAPEGVIALSFNEFTLASQNVISILSENGFTPFRDACFTDLRHEVEQAVSRNVVFAIKNKEDYTL